MVAPQLFKVLTEFKFETGAAIVGASGLQKSVDGIASSADSALFSLQRLGFGLVANFGLGASSFLGIFQQAIGTSEKFKQNQLEVAGLISANLNNLTGNVGTFADRLEVSKRILRDIAKDAQTFGLDERALTATTKLTAGFLLPKGLAGDNFSEARDLSRNFLKSAPTLGVDPRQAEGQLLRAIEGSASLGDTLFRRLNAETEVFQTKLKGAKNAAKAFNKLPIKERFDTIKKGFQQFSSDVDVLSGNANTFGSLFRRLRDSFTGLNGILKPLGDAVSGPLKDGFNALLTVVNTEGRRAFQLLAEAIKPAVSNLDGLVVSLIQVSRLGNDVKKAGKVTAFGAIIAGFASFFAKSTLFKLAMRTIIFSVGGAIAVSLGLGKAFLLLSGVFGFLIGAVVKFLPVFILLTAFFQLISRAVAIAKVRDAKTLPGVIVKFMEILAELKKTFLTVFAPVIKIFDDLAQFLSPLFSVSFGLNLVIKAMRLLSNVVTAALSTIQGAMFAVLQIFENLKNISLDNINPFANIGKAFGAGADDFLAQILANGGTFGVNDKNVIKNKIDIGKVEIKNSFKEQFEPDRIAFTIKEQLLDAAQNPTGSRNRGFALPGIGN